MSAMQSTENPRIPVSVIIMTKNEEENIAKCLNSVECFDQIFVIDSNSEDRTVEIAQSMDANLFDFNWDGHYPKKKQWCLENLPFRHDWVLYVDADEEVFPELVQEISELMRKGPSHAGYFVKYDYVFLKRRLRFGHRLNKLVLLDRHRSKFLDYDDLSVENMWEVEGHYQPAIDGPVGTLRHKMLHNDHSSLFDYFNKLNKYTDWEAHLRLQGIMRSSESANLPHKRVLQYVFDKMPFKGSIMFLYTYILLLGFLDGRAGLGYAVALRNYYSMISLKLDELKLASPGS